MTDPSFILSLFREKKRRRLEERLLAGERQREMGSVWGRGTRGGWLAGWLAGTQQCGGNGEVKGWGDDGGGDDGGGKDLGWVRESGRDPATFEIICDSSAKSTYIHNTKFLDRLCLGCTSSNHRQWIRLTKCSFLLQHPSP